MTTIGTFQPHRCAIVAGLFTHDVWHCDVLELRDRRRVCLTTYHGCAGTVRRTYPLRRDDTFVRDGRRYRLGQPGERLAFDAAVVH